MTQPQVGDAFGQILRRCWAAGARAGAAYEVIERDDGFIGVDDAAKYFAPESGWQRREQLAGRRDPVPGRAEALGVADEIRVAEPRVHVAPDLQVHLPADQPVGVVDPDQDDEVEP